MTLLGYTRVSAGSPDARPQLNALAFAGVEARDVFSDVTSDAKKPSDPPSMSHLLECAEKGDTIVVWRMDRLGPSLISVLDTVTMLAERGINLHSLQDVIDSSTTVGRLMLKLLTSLAEYERHLSSERIATGMIAARQAGTKLGRPPIDADAAYEKLCVVEQARARGLTAADAAQLVGWSRATLYRHQHRYGSRP
jgi:DNA invertase Pin-like site-specific DNA recombinase